MSISAVKALEASKEKLVLWREYAGAYIGGVEYTQLIRMIDEALASLKKQAGSAAPARVGEDVVAVPRAALRKAIDMLFALHDGGVWDSITTPDEIVALCAALAFPALGGVPDGWRPSLTDLNTIRQWYDALEDLAPQYLDNRDAPVAQRVSDAMNAMLAAAPPAPADGWFAIDDPKNPAPKDGTEIILFSEMWGMSFGEIQIGVWDDDVGGWMFQGEMNINDADVEGDEQEDWQPTHWRPLPEPPASPAPSKGES